MHVKVKHPKPNKTKNGKFFFMFLYLSWWSNDSTFYYLTWSEVKQSIIETFSHLVFLTRSNYILQKWCCRGYAVYQSFRAFCVLLLAIMSVILHVMCPKVLSFKQVSRYVTHQYAYATLPLWTTKDIKFIKDPHIMVRFDWQGWRGSGRAFTFRIWGSSH